MSVVILRMELGRVLGMIEMLYSNREKFAMVRQMEVERMPLDLELLRFHRYAPDSADNQPPLLAARSGVSRRAVSVAGSSMFLETMDVLDPHCTSHHTRLLQTSFAAAGICRPQLLLSQPVATVLFYECAKLSFPKIRR